DHARTASSLPSGLKATSWTRPTFRNVWISAPVAVSQRTAVSSLLPLTRNLPSGLKATHGTDCRWPARIRFSGRPPTCHRRPLLPPPDTSHRPSRLNTRLPPPLRSWCVKAATSRCADRLHNRTTWLFVATARYWPSGLKARAGTLSSLNTDHWRKLAASY